jgi:ferrous iron transport protein A
VSSDLLDSTTLDQLNDAQEAFVVDVRSPDGTLPPDLLRRLAEIGFLPGERVRIVARGVPGGNPLAVRVGTSTFALRHAEARCIYVTLNRAGASA